jgi:hypothetical protein
VRDLERQLASREVKDGAKSLKASEGHTATVSATGKSLSQPISSDGSDPTAPFTTEVDKSTSDWPYYPLRFLKDGVQSISDMPIYKADEQKVTAALVTNAQPIVVAVSGLTYSDDHMYLPRYQLANEEWTNNAIDMCKSMGFCLPSEREPDNSISKRPSACHAEMQLLAYIYFHDELKKLGSGETLDIHVDKEPCSTCEHVIKYFMKHSKVGAGTLNIFARGKAWKPTPYKPTTIAKNVYVKFAKYYTSD